MASFKAKIVQAVADRLGQGRLIAFVRIGVAAFVSALTMQLALWWQWLERLIDTQSLLGTPIDINMQSPAVVSFLTSAVLFAYYSMARSIEKRWPWLRPLGLSRQPSYDPQPPAKPAAKVKKRQSAKKPSGSSKKSGSSKGK